MGLKFDKVIYRRNDAHFKKSESHKLSTAYKRETLKLEQFLSVCNDNLFTKFTKEMGLSSELI